jgi:hypothetical protein
MNRSRFRVRVRFWQKLEALHENDRKVVAPKRNAARLRAATLSPPLRLVARRVAKHEQFVSLETQAYEIDVHGSVPLPRRAGKAVPRVVAYHRPARNLRAGVIAINKYGNARFDWKDWYAHLSPHRLTECQHDNGNCRAALKS